MAKEELCTEQKRRLFRLLAHGKDEQVRQELPQMMTSNKDLDLNSFGEGRWSKFPALAMAVIYAPSLINFLVTLGADLNKRDGENLTLLHRAAHTGQLLSAQTIYALAPHLITAEAPEFFRHADGSGATPFDVAVRFRRTVVANWLLSRIAPDSHETALSLPPQRSSSMLALHETLNALCFKDCQEVAGLPIATKLACNACERSMAGAVRDVAPPEDEEGNRIGASTSLRLRRESTIHICM
mmetsp:Transcript_22923/g.52550  ORF Transcript_22923/g.52550 Transcript_22923/m.52550 type:complete len:241 (+) Transcript_22923:116-838(+)